MKKKIFLMLAVVAMLVCVLAVSVSAHDVTRKVTLDSGAEVALYDNEGYALTYYLDGEGNLVSARTVDVITVNGSGVASYSGFNAMSVVVANFQGAEVEALNVKQVPSFYKGSYGGGYHSYNDITEYIYLPDTLTTTVTNQFRCTSKLKIVDVTRNSNWETMGQYCFYYATGLTEFNYPPKVETTPGSSNDGDRGTAATFSRCTSLKSLYFYDNSEVKTFGASCFADCIALETVVLPNSLTELPKSLFSGCSSLTEITIPNSVKTIASHALAWCSSLEVIRMGASVEYFNNTGDNSFTYKTGKVKEIYIPKTFYKTAPDTSLGYQVSYAFSDVTSDCKFFYCGTVEEFATAKANFLTQKSATSNNGAFINATVITYAEYLADTDAYAKGRYVVCDYNTCDAFYGSQHSEDNNPCVVNCTQCGLSGVAEKNPVHSTVVVMSYTNLFAPGLKTTACTNDGCQLCDEETLKPIFHWVGYSAKTFGDEKAFGQQYVINQTELGAYKAYVEAQGDIFSYGVVAAGASSAGQPLSVAGNEVVNKEGAQSICFDQLSYDAFFMNISGIDAGSLDVELMCCAYVRVGDEIVYLDNNQTVDTVELTSFAKIDAIVNPKEDIA